MREVRVPVSELRPGEVIVKLGGREINSRFRELAEVRVGTRVRGPRGGLYELNARGAREYVVVVTYGGRPLARRDGFATVLRGEE